jgi:hypothetical protein
LLGEDSVVEAKFGLFEKEGKMGFRNAVVGADGALGRASLYVIVAFAGAGA